MGKKRSEQRESIAFNDKSNFQARPKQKKRKMWRPKNRGKNKKWGESKGTISMSGCDRSPKPKGKGIGGKRGKSAKTRKENKRLTTTPKKFL